MGGNKPEVEVTLEQWLAMGEAERAALPKARQKKMAKLADQTAKKMAKAQAAAQNAPPPGQSNRAKKKAEQSQAAAAAAAAAGTDEALPPSTTLAEQYVDKTPPGSFKDMSAPMMASYHPKAVEAAWYAYWEAAGYFKADPAKAVRNGQPPFVMVIPPPNVTGTLHIGHTLTNAIQDCLTRWHRMSGRTALWIPGMDHAGIATQTVVEKRLWKDHKITRHDLGRETFVEKVWEWKEEYGSRIRYQTQRQAASVDWDREEFTMSPRLSAAVREGFVRMYDMGLIYRDTRLVNWCCKLTTALSEMEVDYINVEGRTMIRVPGYDEKVEFGMLTNFAYQVEDSDEQIVVATTRLETMFGDVAVAVHPDDDRYKHLVGKRLVHPFVDRKLDVIADSELVKMDFGSGAVKITPAHDPNDYSCGRRHNLPEISVIDENGCMTSNCASFSGMKRYTARVEVEKALQERGLLRGKDVNPEMRLGLCSRTGDVIEPLLKPQWYVSCADMAKRSLDATDNLDLTILPAGFRSTWTHWMTNIRDWCVSRQLWWGHRIPAYKVRSSESPGKEHWVVGRDEDEARARAANEFGWEAASITLSQDPDVLDTWFSSGLFPFSTVGWPDTECADYKAFYPNSMIETGHDILFFWVARMVMMGLTLTGKLPFKTVFLHPMVRDKHGRKMSKSLGNVIDPLELYEGSTLQSLIGKLHGGNLADAEIAKATASMKADYPDGIPECGSDAVRFGLLAYTVQERDLNLDVNRVVSYRHFCNKLWNLTKFAISGLGADFVFSEAGLARAVSAAATGEDGSVADLWILARLKAAARKCNEGLAGFKFADVTGAIYNFFLYDLCDVYLEVSKPILRGGGGPSGGDEKCGGSGRAVTSHVLYHCLHTGLRLLHPLMPFVTEELFQRLPNRRQHDSIESIMMSAYPQAADTGCMEANVEADSVRRMEHGMRIAKEVRALRLVYSLKPSARPEITIVCRSGAAAADARAGLRPAQTLCSAGAARVVDGAVVEQNGEGASERYGDGGFDRAGAVGCVVDDYTQVFVGLSGLVDFAGELRRLEVSAGQKRGYVDVLRRQMSAAGYEKIPESVRESIGEKAEKARQELRDVEELVVRMQALARDSPPTVRE